MAELPGEASGGAQGPAPEETEGGGADFAGCVNAVTGASWWGGLIQAAKTKSVSAIDFMKKDLVEFTHTMQNESGSLATNVKGKLNHETAVAATQKVKHGMSALIDGIKTALIIPPEDMGEEDNVPLTVSGGQFFDRAKARLHAVQIDPGTYCSAPSGSPADFDKWKSKFELESKKGDISELLVANVQVRALYTQMVPGSVSHADFWKRYFYKLHQLDQEEQRRDNLKKRADVVKVEDDLAWDDEDDWDNMDAPSQESAEAASAADTTEESSSHTKATTLPNPDQTDSSHTTTSDIQSSIGNTDKIVNTDDSVTNEQKRPENHDVNASSSSDIETTTTAARLDQAASSSATDDTISESSAITDTDKDNAKLSSASADTLTVVTAESTSDIPDPADAPSVRPDEDQLNEDRRNDQLTTREKGDIVVVVDGNNSQGNPSPPTSDSNSHSKGTDDDWEKDFDIEVTEEELSQFKQTSDKDLAPEIKEGDDDWENWE